MTKPTIGTVHQQLNDNINYSKERFDRLELQLSSLNIAFRKNVSTVEQVKTIQKNCPARIAMVKGRIPYYLFNTITVLIASAAVVITVKT